MSATGVACVVTLVIAMVLYLYFRQDSSACGAMPRRDHPTPDPRIVCCPPLLLYMTAYGATYYRTVLFYPHVPIHKTTENPEPYRSPSYYGLPFREVHATTADGETLHCWLIQQRFSPETKPTLIFFHGNAGNMGLRLPNFKRIYETTGVNIFSVDYRGYGLSTGSPSEQGLLLDAEAALDALLAQPDVHTGRIAVFGRSLGGAVATHLAYKRPEAIKAVVLENTFLNISKMVDKLFPILVPLKPWILTLNFNTSDKIQYVRAPILLFSGGMDQLVPPSHMEELYELARRTSKDCIMHRVPQGTHENTHVAGGTQYYAAMHSFLSRHVGQKAQVGEPPRKQVRTDGEVEPPLTRAGTDGGDSDNGDDSAVRRRGKRARARGEGADGAAQGAEL